MTKMLNLDEVAAKSERVLRINDQTYPMVEISVDAFVEMTSELERVEEDVKAGKITLTIADQVDMMVKSIQRAFPSCPTEVLRSRPISQLYLIVDFVRGDLEAGAEELKGKK